PLHGRLAHDFFSASLRLCVSASNRSYARSCVPGLRPVGRRDAETQRRREEALSYPASWPCSNSAGRDLALDERLVAARLDARGHLVEQGVDRDALGLTLEVQDDAVPEGGLDHRLEVVRAHVVAAVEQR